MTDHRRTVHRKNALRLVLLAAMVLMAVAFYLLINSHPEKPKLFRYILSLRVPTLVCILIDLCFVQFYVYGADGKGIDSCVLVREIGIGAIGRHSDHDHCTEGQQQCLGSGFHRKTSFLLLNRGPCGCALSFLVKLELISSYANKQRSG